MEINGEVVVGPVAIDEEELIGLETGKGALLFGIQHVHHAGPQSVGPSREATCPLLYPSTASQLLSEWGYGWRR